MNINKLTILFYIHRNRVNKKGLCPLKCRITYNKKRKDFSTGLFINPDYWDNKKQIAFTKDDNYINNQIGLIKNKINQVFLYLKVNENEFDVFDIYLKLSGKNTKANKTIMEVFDLHNNKMKKLVGNGYAKSTYNKFLEAKMHTQSFIKHSYNRNDFMLEKLSLKFLDDFDFYLKTTKNHKQVTINKTIQRVRKIIKVALSEGYLTKDPFILYKPKRVINKLVYLSSNELYRIENYVFKQKRLQLVKDLFIFCCYSGLAYQEMSTLSTINIKNDENNNFWIELTRKKTGKDLYVPLLPKALDILKKYDMKLPKISNQKFNSYLKEIADIIGINKRLTHHIARKTFATTVLLNNDVPIEVVSELLGHSSIQMTQKHYAKVIKSRINKEIKNLRLKLE
uniref:site-specific integrase n=1 Tax=uncultured Polaribacter sp. TaxID=174711 RepID=UPI002629F198|nr:site-specific integrase [uncultured Polaribacter sp.]